MRSLLSLGLLMTVCASANAATVNHHRTRHHVITRPSPVVTAPGQFAVPGWSDDATRRWLDNASAPGRNAGWGRRLPHRYFFALSLSSTRARRRRSRSRNGRRRRRCLLAWIRSRNLTAIFPWASWPASRPGLAGSSPSWPVLPQGESGMRPAYQSRHPAPLAERAAGGLL